MFYLANITILLFLFKRDSIKRERLEYQIEQLQEKLNILKDENSKELQNRTALEARIIRYDSLKKVVEEINENLSLDSVANNLTSIAFSLISNNRGTCNLYLVDNQTQKISLFKTKKEDADLIIKAKEGDIFDFWVLRHATPLFVEDVKSDFRFDLEKLKEQEFRPISSLISSPLLSENRFLGILRLDNPAPTFYLQDDLRFLVRICDLGAVALENSELFQKTQDLAIHDELTSLYTKGYFLERLKEECLRAQHEGGVFSLLMLDIDFFKDYNDRFGHTVGDMVLKNLSRNITESLSDLSPIVGRFGGEEFCIVLEGLDKKKAYSVAGSLCKGIEKEKIILRRQATNVTVSIGIATFPTDATSDIELIQQADKAMYEAKQKGRNRACSI